MQTDKQARVLNSEVRRIENSSLSFITIYDSIKGVEVILTPHNKQTFPFVSASCNLYQF